MWYEETKIYHDGSHYIAIPHTTNPKPRRPRPKETEIEVVEEIEPPQQNMVVPKIDSVSVAAESEVNEGRGEVVEPIENTPPRAKETPKTTRKMTRKELFNKIYDDTRYVTKKEQKEKLMKGMRPYFRNEQATINYVEANLRRKKRNLICRRIRFTRKANLQEFNYFVTFTYDGKIHTEESFKRGLTKCLQNLHTRKGWKYMGVWERSPKKKRLHFHGLLYIPDGMMVGELFEKNDYNLNSHRRQITVQNTFFNKKFGRCDFELIEHKNGLGSAMAYIMKYIEKSGEKIVYSRGLPQFFISDIMDDDVVTTIGMEDKKLLLFDDFTCFDEGELVGKVGAETIKRLRTSN